MTDRLAAAAAALGVPEPILKRSAEARAAAAGVSVDQILEAWTGGSPAPAATAPPSTAPAPADQPPPAPAQAEPVAVEPEPAPSATPLPPPGSGSVRPGPALPSAPPILVGRREPAGVLVAGVLGLLILSLLLGVAAPSVPPPANGVRSSNHQFSAAALAGRQAYLEAGCGSCHTQVVRNLVSDVGLGPVTLADSNQVLGYRRYGPDLAAVGSRITDRATFETILGGGAGHPRPSGLSSEELDSLIAYLMESG